MHSNKPSVYTGVHGHTFNSVSGISASGIFCWCCDHRVFIFIRSLIVHNVFLQHASTQCRDSSTRSSVYLISCCRDERMELLTEKNLNAIQITRVRIRDDAPMTTYHLQSGLLASTSTFIPKRLCEISQWKHMLDVGTHRCKHQWKKNKVYCIPLAILNHNRQH